MRLTLRTLLAYLDDRLPPANAREIGQKIANSPFATELVERIRDVKRRRRLATPSRVPPTIDANLVAEYLDDQLTPELVAKVETQILSSDALLAEVASAHEILGLLRDPVSIEPRLTDRLYGLDPSGKTELIRTLAGDHLAAGHHLTNDKEWKPLASRLSRSGRFPVILMGVLALVWTVVLLTDSRLFGTRSGDSTPVASDVEKPLEVADAAVDPIEANEAPQAPAEQPVADANEPATDANGQPAATNPESVAAAEVVPATTSEPVVTENSDAIPIATNDKPEMAVAASDVRVVPPPPLPGDGEPVVVPPPIAEEPVAYYLMADNRSVLSLDVGQKVWTTLAQIPGGDAVGLSPNRVNVGPILSARWFAIPDSFRLTVQSDPGGWTATLIGPAQVRLIQGAAGGLEIYEGRLWLTVDPGHPWNAEDAPTFLLRAGDTQTELRLTSAEADMALEITPETVEFNDAVAADSTDPGEVGEDLKVVLFPPHDTDLRVTGRILRGSAQVAINASEEPVDLSQNDVFAWDVLDLTQTSTVLTERDTSPVLIPDWMLSRNAGDIEETAALKARLLNALQTNADPISSVLPLLDDRNPLAGELAVQVLSVTRDIDRLLTVLFEPRDERLHRAAVDGLSVIARSSQAGRLAVQRSLETRLPMAEVEPMLQLISGLTPAQASDLSVVEDLMAMLASDRLATRTLAVYRMEQFAGDRMGYHPDAEASRRREGIRRWQRYLDRNAGKLIP
jgi:hypothetical protein